MEYTTIIYIFAFVCACLLIFGEVRRMNKARLVWRIIAEIIVVLSLVFIIVPPRYRSDLYVKNELGLQSSGGPSDPIFAIVKNGRPQVVADLDYYLKSNTQISSINITGFGLSDVDLKKIVGYPVTFAAPDTPSGFIRGDWNSKLQLGKMLLFQGSYFNGNGKKVRLVLKGLGTTLDSLSINKKGLTQLSLRHLPVQPGKVVYQLLALSGLDTLSSEPLPFEVIPSVPLKVVVLAAAPDFEYRFLKSWLFKEKHSVVLRSRISKEKYSFDLFNTERKSFVIDRASLNATDLIIADEEELDAMTINEKALVGSAVKDGMGLLVRLSDRNLKAKSSLINGLSRYQDVDSLRKQLEVSIQASGSVLSPLNIGQVIFLNKTEFSRPLMKDKAGKTLASVYLSGSGKITGSVLSTTYSWLLAGSTAAYHEYWTELISKTARESENSLSISLNPKFPEAGNTTRIAVEQNTSSRPLVEIEEQAPAVRQNIQFPYQWDMLYWPRKTGWNTIRVNDQSASFFVYDKASWQSQAHFEAMKRTTQFVAKQKNVEKQPDTNVAEEKEVPAWIFFLLFVLFAGFLWVEPRVFS
ncbi:MAG: hypothetical protein V4687_05625 [Bacteroidota bacterium]